LAYIQIIKQGNVGLNSSKKEKSPVQMFRLDRERYITIEGGIDSRGSLNDIKKSILKILMKKKNNKDNPAK
jgi:multidrug efflux pump subunit AcrB